MLRVKGDIIPNEIVSMKGKGQHALRRCDGRWKQQLRKKKRLRKKLN
jgi:hypothetical protein